MKLVVSNGPIKRTPHRGQLRLVSDTTWQELVDDIRAIAEELLRRYQQK